MSNVSNSMQVEHPKHYGGAENPYEAIKVIEAWDLGFNLGNTVKYISRAGKKNPEAEVEDLEKALWYLKREIANRSASRFKAVAEKVIQENTELLSRLGDGKTMGAIWTPVLYGEET